jgi:DNA primase
VSEEEAIKDLCTRYNIEEYKNYSNNTSGDANYDKYVKVYKFVTDLFFTKYGLCKTNVDYWKSRGLESLIEEYQLFYVPEILLDKEGRVIDFRTLLWKHFTDITPAVFDTFGLYDKDNNFKFAGRFIIPIRNDRGDIVAFSGRSLNPNEAKYINTSETPYFKKGELLFNWDKARYPMRDLSGDDSYRSLAKYYTIVVEGYMDCLALVAAGVPNVVATMGTALCAKQIKTIHSRVTKSEGESDSEFKHRLIKSVVLSLDNDDAGKDAMYKLCKDYTLSVLPVAQTFAYKDFNEALCAGFELKTYVTNRFKDLLSGAEYSFSYLKDHTNLSNATDTAEMWSRLSTICKRYSPIVQDKVAVKFRRLIKGKRYNRKEEN